MIHRPVLLELSVEAMALEAGMVVVDGTVGAAGHARAFLQKVLPGGFLLGFDRDPQVAELAARELVSAGFTRGKHFEIEVRRFSQVDEALACRRPPDFDRLFLDLGVCSLHLDVAERGFSLKRDAPLDMRMNPQEQGSRSAAEIVNGESEAGLARIFAEYGEERYARQVARAIVRARARQPVRATLELREIVARSIPRRAWPPRIDPATRVFQALRMKANRELEELDEILGKLPGHMKPGSRAGIISFESLTDRRIKRAFRAMAQGCVCPPEQPVCTCGRKPQFKLVNSRVISAGPDEIGVNPRARSAKLRVVERLQESSKAEAAAGG
ncbi:MAG: 16S rRNA (cytosine(1402)-N(4))-methyltransferase RsmH [Candidatus Sumerlaeota bacterium]|nr:16S rRNA (cytosine(1402)-N(4))-methyltransferase RsmH [Candidatus Sumerlaeota bacterium]